MRSITFALVSSLCCAALLVGGCQSGPETPAAPEPPAVRPPAPDEPVTPVAEPPAEKPAAGKLVAPGEPKGLKIVVNDAKQVSHGAGAWTGAADCSAVAYLAMDDNAITVTVQVTDDQNWAGSGETFLCDSVELYFDIRKPADRGKAYYDKGVLQVVIVPGMGKAADTVSWHQGPDSEGAEVEVDGMTTKSAPAEKGYTLVVMLPLKGFEKNHGAAPGRQFNFVLGLNDADGGEADCQLLSAGTDDNWQDASGFAPVDLSK